MLAFFVNTNENFTHTLTGLQSLDLHLACTSRLLLLANSLSSSQRQLSCLHHDCQQLQQQEPQQQPEGQRRLIGSGTSPGAAAVFGWRRHRHQQTCGDRAAAAMQQQ
jgi:hypothetical protein